MGRRRDDLTGRTFGRLVVNSFAGTDPHSGECLWHVTCSCGNVAVKRGSNLRYCTRSCGCYQLEIARESGKKRRTHGLSKHPLLNVWSGIVRRCTNPTSTDWPDYGGRGITICEDWVSTPAAFVKWVESSLGPRPSEEHSLDRIDVNGDYEPRNLRWATSKQQAANTRRKRLEDFSDEEITKEFTRRSLYVGRG